MEALLSLLVTPLGLLQVELQRSCVAAVVRSSSELRAKRVHLGVRFLQLVLYLIEQAVRLLRLGLLRLASVSLRLLRALVCFLLAGRRRSFRDVARPWS
jgi:hypothetical protein